MDKPFSVLLLADNRRGHTGNLLAHISAYRDYSRHRVSVFNPRDVATSRFLDLSPFDVVVIHYSLVITADSYLPRFLRDRIGAFDGLKLQFLQDEYRWVDAITSCMRTLGIDVLFSIAPEREFAKLYAERLPGTRIVPTLAGFVPDSIVGRRAPDVDSRPIDIGYRGRMLPYWLGALSQEKARIGPGVLAGAEAAGLRCDISSSENQRVYGRRWERFLCSCKSMLGTESGASITDFDGSVERATLAYLAHNPAATFEEVSEAVLAPYESNVMINVPSPRIFESAAFRTAMVLFPGEYGGVVRPGEHYLPLEKDFSNLPEVIEALRDTASLRKMTDRAYADIVASGRYSLRNEVAAFDSILEELVVPRSLGRGARFQLARLERPFTTGVIAGLDLRDPVRAVVWAVAASRLVVGSRTLRSLVRAYAGSRQVRRGVRLRRLVDDLLRLGLLLRAQEGRPVTAERFSIVTTVDEANGNLVFLSTRNEPRTRAPVGLNELAPRGAVRTLLWDNRAFGPGVHYLFLGRGVGLRVGYHGHVGVYHFSALETIARHRPEPVVAALHQLSRRRSRRRSRGLALRLAWLMLPSKPLRKMIRWKRRRQQRRRPPLLIALFCSPRNYLFKGALACRAVMIDPALRRIAIVGLRDPAVRAAGGWIGLLEDIVKLKVLHDAIDGQVQQVASVQVTQAGDQLTFLSDAGKRPTRARRQLDRRLVPKRIAWDNRPVGSVLPVPVRLHRRLFISFEPTGIHEYRALEALFATSPELVWDALERRVQ